jgi:uncharacterized HAD superfamily protein
MKDKLLKILSNPQDKLICVDIDGTISMGEFWGTGEPEPIKDKIDYFNSLYKRGAHIVMYTAREPAQYTITHSWLIKNGVMFHGIAMRMKPGADLYIDDKALNIDDIVV